MAKKGGLGSIMQVALPVIGAAVGGPLGAEAGIGATAGGALGGAAGGVLGGGGVKGALLGGLSGGLAPNLGDIADGLGLSDAASGVAKTLGLGGDAVQATGGDLASAAGTATDTASGAVSAGSGAAGAAGSNVGGMGFDLGIGGPDTSGIDSLVSQINGGNVGQSSVGAGTAAANAAGSTAGGNAAGGGLAGFLKNNSNVLLPAGSIAMSALKGQQEPKGYNQLNATAGQEKAIGTDLANTLNSGQLPAGAESMVQNAVNDGIASIRSKYAQMGLSGSTMEAQEVQALQERAQSTRFQMANDLTKTGLTALNSSSAIFQALMQQQMQQDQELTNSISGLAEASALGNALKG